MAWLRELSVGLEDHGLLEAYVTPFDWPHGAAPAAMRVMPAPVAAKIRSQLRRRELPGGFDRAKLRHRAAVLEFSAVMAKRQGARATADRLTRIRNAHFDRALRTELRPVTAAIVAAQGAALRSFRRASESGIVTLLDYPIAHHAFAESILGEEAKREPHFAGTLQFHQFPPRQRAHLEAEIEIADRIIVLSSFQKETFVDCGVDEAKLMVTPLGVDVELFRPPEPDHTTDDDVFRVIFVGQIGQRKGLSYLLDAFRQASIPRSELVLVGSVVGTGKPWRGQPGVRHVPHVARWKLPSLYHSADAFVFPSLVEGFPQTPLEAMACGLPTIVSTNTFADDVVEDGRDGFIVPIRDARAIAERIRHLFESPGVRRDVGQRAREKAKVFSWERYRTRSALKIGEVAGLLHAQPVDPPRVENEPRG